MDPLHVDARGEGPPVLLVHGFTGSAEAWGEKVLDGLARDHRVLAVDLPGHGRSPAPPGPDELAIERVVERLTGELDRRGLERAAWVGYSMGGRIALAAAVLAPERVGPLVLEGASPGLRTAEERRERRASDERLARDLETDGIEPFVERWMALPLFETQRRLPAPVLERERERRLGNRPDALAAWLRGAGTGAQPSFWDALAGVRSPVLLLTGAEDPKFTRIAREMAGLLPRASRVPVVGAGHTVHLERPERWLREARGFLAAHSGWRPGTAEGMHDATGSARAG